MTCMHSNLIARDDFSGVDITVNRKKPSNNIEIEDKSQVSGMFMYKKYDCDYCGKIITVLQAVVEDVS